MLAGAHRKDHDPDREDVTLRRPQTLVPDLRRHVAWGAAWMGPRGELVGERKVDDYDLRPFPVGGASDHDIGLLQVAVHDVVSVQEGNTLEDLQHDVREPRLVHDNAGIYRLAHGGREVTPKVRLLHDVDVGLILEDLEDVGDQRMLDFHEKLELAGDVLHCIVGARLVIHLQNNLPVVLGIVPAEEDGALATLAKLALQSVSLLNPPVGDAATKPHCSCLRGLRCIPVLAQHGEAQLDPFLLVKQAIAGKVKSPKHLAHLTEDSRIHLQLLREPLCELVHVLEAQDQPSWCGPCTLAEVLSQPPLQRLRLVEQVHKVLC
mmetsp:Transcript_107166/g.341374  ORF Transcript_107166/g.341374 Transcript_107166/m.341374 type:complete len:320 (-) Transcript_107166:64-1023(-)